MEKWPRGRLSFELRCPRRLNLERIGARAVWKLVEVTGTSWSQRVQVANRQGRWNIEKIVVEGEIDGSEGDQGQLK